MKLDIQNNEIIKIANTIEKGKEYSHNLSGKTFSFQDFQLPILHKKKIKIIHWKDLGNKMQVFFSKQKIETKNGIPPLDQYKEEFETALDLFRGFDEEQGEEYSFLYKISQRKIEELAPLFSYFELTLENKNNIWTKKIGKKIGKNTDIKQRENRFKILAFFFGLLNIYGNVQKKKENVLGIKIAIPLFGRYIQQKNIFLNLIKTLANKYGIFISYHIQESKDGKIIEIKSNDSELLTIFSQWKKTIEKQNEITIINKTLEETKTVKLLEEKFTTDFTDLNECKIKLLIKE